MRALLFLLWGSGQAIQSVVQIPLNPQPYGPSDGAASPYGYSAGTDRDPAAIALAKGLTDSQILAEENDAAQRSELAAASGAAQLSLSDADARSVESSNSHLDQARKQEAKEEHRLRQERNRDHHQELMTQKELTRQKLRHNKVLDGLEDEDNEVRVADEEIEGEEEREHNEFNMAKAEGMEEIVRQKAEGDSALGNLAAAGKMKLAEDLSEDMPSSPETALDELLNCDEEVEPVKGNRSREAPEELEVEESLDHVDCVPAVDVSSVQDMLKQKVRGTKADDHP